MSIRSLADFNGGVPLVRVLVLVGTDTVTRQGALLVDQVIEVGTLVGQVWRLSHGHGHGTSECAERMGAASPQIVYAWRRRYPDFLRAGNSTPHRYVWNRPEVERWARRRTG